MYAEQQIKDEDLKRLKFSSDPCSVTEQYEVYR